LNATPTKGALRVGDWKLILNGGAPEADEAAAGAATQGRDRVELFNLAQDPDEKTNLAEEQPDRVRTLRARYAAIANEAVPPKSRPRQRDFKAPSVWGEAP
jgi:arylsulfatase A-like enzyme